jgi:hypothetical protein
MFKELSPEIVELNILPKPLDLPWFEVISLNVTMATYLVGTLLEEDCQMATGTGPGMREDFLMEDHPIQDDLLGGTEMDILDEVILTKDGLEVVPLDQIPPMVEPHPQEYTICTWHPSVMILTMSLSSNLSSD